MSDTNVTTLQKAGTVAGRLFFTLIFIMSGLGKIADWAGTTAYMSAAGMPMVDLFLAGAIALEVVGGLSILLGYRARWGALLLIVFLVPASFIGTYVAMMIWIAGMKYTDTSIASVLNQTSVLIVPILAAIFLKERLTKRKVAAIVLGFVGAALAAL